MSKSAGTTTDVITLPKGGGALRGIGETFSPDLHTGTGSFSVPIDVPPGRNGFQPQLALSYSTAYGNGPFGLGWAVGIPEVARKTSRGIPNYIGDDDTFVLSGAEDLVRIAPVVSAVAAEYRPRTEGLFASILHHRTERTDHWEVRTKNGLVSLYGTPESRGDDPAAIVDPADDTRVFAWKLTQTRDTFGNRIVYEYDRDSDLEGPHQWDQLYLRRIRYVDSEGDGNPIFLVSVTFTYSDRPDPFSSYRSGFELRTRWRCRTIDVRTHAGTDRDVRTYHLGYQDDATSSMAGPVNGVSLLRHIIVEGHDDEFANLLENGNFAVTGRYGSVTHFSGTLGEYSAAAGWTLWHNGVAKTDTALVPSTFTPGLMLHVNTTNARCGLVQVFGERDRGPQRATFSAWVFVRRGQVGIGTGNGGSTGIDAVSHTTNQWELLRAPNGVSPANQCILYATSVGGAEFYVADASVAEAARREALPPLQFEYTAFEPAGRRFTRLEGPDPSALSFGRNNRDFADLFGNGLPDVVEVGGAARYWRNLGGGRFDRPRAMTAAPAGLSLVDSGVQLLDATGDGRADLLCTTEWLSGYYSLTSEGAWGRFHEYQSAPTFDLKDPEVRLIDLDGNGVTDAIRSGQWFECFFSDPDKGWTGPRLVERGVLVDFPNVSFSDPRVKLADMTGDGLQDVVLVHNRRIDYWPNLGFGRWGRRVTMWNSPAFDDGFQYAGVGFDPKRLLLGDIDGDGLADIVYVGSRQVSVWINQSGNGWSEPAVIRGTPQVTDMDTVRLADVYGNGTAGILWSTGAAGQPDTGPRFLDLTGGRKPYLLSTIDNQMGAVTRVTYASSTQFYLADEQDPATRWKTPLPFPVQVVAAVNIIDALSGGALSTTYSYHHGYWDGYEREFRGFGRVDQRDTETFESAPEAGQRSAVETFSPPTETRTWFHQGPIGTGDGEWGEANYVDEYWVGDPTILRRPADVESILLSLPRLARRDALRTLRGSVLRTELYALDGSVVQGRPFTVTESVHGLREEFVPDVAEPERARIFFPHPISQRTTQWERGDDPLTRFVFTGDYDDYGQARQQTHLDSLSARLAHNERSFGRLPRHAR